MVSGRDDQPAGGEGAFDPRRRVNLERALGDQFADDPALDYRLGDERIGIHEVTFLFNDQPAVGAEIFDDSLSDLIIAQINVAAAALAHRRFGGDRHVQFRVALKTTNRFLIDDRLLGADWHPRRDKGLRLQPEMFPAFFTNSRVGALRLRLCMPAFGAGYHHGRRFRHKPDANG
jgi:hypothetical protein